jgi:hypothetical protein
MTLYDSPMNLGKLTLEQLRYFSDLARTVDGPWQESIGVFDGNPELLKLDGYGPLPWAFLYEVPLLTIAHLFVRAVAEEHSALPADAKPITLEAMRALVESNWEDELPVNEIQEVMPILAPLGAAMYRTLKSISYFGCSLNTLVARARAGDDPSLLKAVRIDPGVLTGPTGAARLNQAVLLAEKKFLASLASAMTRPPKKRLKFYNDIRLVMSLLLDAGATLSDEELVTLFCDQLKMYARGGDTAKALRKLMAEVETPSTTEKWPKWVADLLGGGAINSKSVAGRKGTPAKRKGNARWPHKRKDRGLKTAASKRSRREPSRQRR